MKRMYKTPKAIHVDFHYDVQVRATSPGGGEDVAPFGDPQKIGYCQQSNPASCMYFWLTDSGYCQSAPMSIGNIGSVGK